MDLRRVGNLICDVGLLVGLIALCVLDAGVSHRWRGVVLGIGTVAMLAAFLIGVPVRIVGWLGGRRARRAGQGAGAAVTSSTSSSETSWRETS